MIPKVMEWFKSGRFLLIGLLLFLTWLRSQLKEQSKYSVNVTLNDSYRRRLECDHFSFSLHGMSSCIPLLNCTTIENEMKRGRLIGVGSMKKAFLANWKGYKVVWNELHYHMIRDNVQEFQRGITMLRILKSKNHFITLIIGVCKTVMITEYHRFGAVINLNNILNSVFHQRHEFSVRYRMQLCKDYVTILKYLHNGHHNRTYVVCDSESLKILLTQYLLTDDLHLVFNDGDAVQHIDKTESKSVICSSQEQFGNTFIRNREYNEMNDIWKIPDVCEFFLGEYYKVKELLADIHLKCKHRNPKKRPTASQVLEIYKEVKVL